MDASSSAPASAVAPDATDTSIANEQLEGLAGALDAAAIACLSAGVLAPIVLALYHQRDAPPMETGAYVVVGIFVWLGAAIRFHLAGRGILEGLRA